jgi:transposase
MMGRLNRDQGQLFYSFCLDEAVPDDHRVREIAAVLDLSWVHAELAPHYSHLGRPSIDPVLMIRMLILGYAFAIRSERLLCREVQVNLAYRWFCGLSIETRSRTILLSRVLATSASARATCFGVCSSGWWRPASRQVWWVAKASQSMPA